MNDSHLKGILGTLRATVTVTRKATGKVETHQLIGHPDPKVLAAILAEDQKRNTETKETQ